MGAHADDLFPLFFYTRSHDRCELFLTGETTRVGGKKKKELEGCCCWVSSSSRLALIKSYICFVFFNFLIIILILFFPVAIAPVFHKTEKFIFLKIQKFRGSIFFFFYFSSIDFTCSIIYEECF
jgi:hypothetical protein